MKVQCNKSKYHQQNRKMCVFSPLLQIAEHVCLCVIQLQVVCEKGLGVNGMSLTSLRDEGFKAVFVGIGKETLQLAFH